MSELIILACIAPFAIMAGIICANVVCNWIWPPEGLDRFD